jgi:hypothetical protein
MRSKRCLMTQVKKKPRWIGAAFRKLEGEDL